MTHAKILGQAFDALLQPEKFRDYGPNGLQVEGDRNVQRLVSGVTASRALIEAAIAAEADAIVVHHGLFWRGQDGRDPELALTGSPKGLPSSFLLAENLIFFLKLKKFLLVLPD